MTDKPKVLVIVGPTASGKTSLSIKLAQNFSGEVISSDSRQVYRGLDIGTEKVTASEMAGIPHHLLDVVDPATVFTAKDFAESGQAAITTISERDHLPIIAGGTFFYVDALLGRMVAPEVAPNEALRTELETLSTEALFERLKVLDPRRADDIDRHNPRRLMRAIEIATALGSVPPPAAEADRYDVLTIGIETPREVLRQRIRDRAQQALTRGLIEETQSLLTDGLSRERLAEIGLEYRIIMEHLDGALTDEKLIQKLEEKNWQYAKRQLTWLKRDETIAWFPLSDYDSIKQRASDWLTH